MTRTHTFKYFSVHCLPFGAIFFCQILILHCLHIRIAFQQDSVFLCENHNLITIRAFKPFFHAQIPVCLKRLFFLSEDVLLAISPPPKHWPLLRNEKRIVAFTHKLYLQKATVVDFYIAYVIISRDEVRHIDMDNKRKLLFVPQNACYFFSSEKQCM